MNNSRWSKFFADTLLILLVLIASSQSIVYLLSPSTNHLQFLRYFGLSPYAIAFVHPSFFSSKEIVFHYPDSHEVVNPLKYDELFTNRALYRTVMFTFESNRSDVETITRYFLCKPERNPIARALSTTQDPDAVELIRFAQNSTQSLKVLCNP